MLDVPEIIRRLTTSQLTADERLHALNQFAHATGWKPSDALLEYRGTEEFATGHLVVEHGLQTTAVLSFLKDGLGFTGLARSERLSVLSISYNNLTDWHLFPEVHGLSMVNNRQHPHKISYIALDEDVDLWRVESFERSVRRTVSPNLKSLDDALIDTIAFWRRVIAGELGGGIPNHSFAALFNILLLLRAVEDQQLRQDKGGRQPLLYSLTSSDWSLPK